MKKLLKADEIKLFAVADGAALAKGRYAQLILAAKRAAVWAAETDADIVITHCATVGGTYTAFKTFNVAPGASDSVQFQVDLVGVKDFFKITLEKNATPAVILDVIGAFADSEDVDTADVEELPVPAVIFPTISL